MPVRGTLAQLVDWRRRLETVQRDMEGASGERGPTKAENLVQYALEEVCDDIKREKEPKL